MADSTSADTAAASATAATDSLAVDASISELTIDAGSLNASGASALAEVGFEGILAGLPSFQADGLPQQALGDVSLGSLGAASIDNFGIFGSASAEQLQGDSQSFALLQVSEAGVLNQSLPADVSLSPNLGSLAFLSNTVTALSISGINTPTAAITSLDSLDNGLLGGYTGIATGLSDDLTSRLNAV